MTSNRKLRGKEREHCDHIFIFKSGVQKFQGKIRGKFTWMKIRRDTEEKEEC